MQNHTTYGIIRFLTLLHLIILLTVSTGFSARTHYDYRFQAGVIERSDEVRWNIGGKLCSTCDYVDVLSELEWRDVDSTIFDITASVQEHNTDWIASVNAGYGIITDGVVQDSDYLTSGREDEFSRSVNSSAGDDLWYFSLEFGHDFKRRNLMVTPYLGYSYDQINLQMTDGYQVINIDPDTGSDGYTGPFGGLNSSYDASWSGFLIGTSLKAQFGNWLASASGEYHWFNYLAKADWNLRDDFEHPVSFKHKASGDGYHLVASIDYLLTKNFAMGLTYQLRRFVTSAGTDITYFTDGSSGRTPLNEVVWETDTLGLAFKFFY